MALSKEQWDEVSAAMAKLRSLGCAVCIFTPDDVESAFNEADGNEDKPDMTGEQSAAWMDGNRKYLEDGMSTTGNLYIADNIEAVPA